MATNELKLKHNSDSIEIDLGDDEILTLPLPTMVISIVGRELKKINMPPDQLKSLEGEIIGRSFTDLTLDRVAIVDWTVYSDDWDNEQWTVLSWVIAQKGSYDEKRLIEDNIIIMESTKRILEENIDVNQI